MKRSPLLRRTPLARGSSRLGSAKPLARVSEIKRTPLKRKARRAKPGDEPAYKAWIKTLVCCVGGIRCDQADPHHLIDGKGDAKKGMGQTSADRFLLPLCRYHHDLFHEGKGLFKGWDDAQRLTFQEQECERLRAIWADLNEFGTWQEPERRAV